MADGELGSKVGGAYVELRVDDSTVAPTLAKVEGEASTTATAIDSKLTPAVKKASDNFLTLEQQASLAKAGILSVEQQAEMASQGLLVLEKETKAATVATEELGNASSAAAVKVGEESIAFNDGAMAVSRFAREAVLAGLVAGIFYKIGNAIHDLGEGGSASAEKFLDTLDGEKFKQNAIKIDEEIKKLEASASRLGALRDFGITQKDPTEAEKYINKKIVALRKERDSIIGAINAETIRKREEKEDKSREKQEKKDDRAIEEGEKKEYESAYRRYEAQIRLDDRIDQLRRQRVLDSLDGVDKINERERQEVEALEAMRSKLATERQKQELDATIEATRKAADFERQQFDDKVRREDARKIEQAARDRDRELKQAAELGNRLAETFNKALDQQLGSFATQQLTATISHLNEAIVTLIASQGRRQ